MLVQIRSSRDGAKSVGPVKVTRRVALIVMPVHLPTMPSLAVATLAEGLRAQGHAVDVFPLHVSAVRDLGLAEYEVIGAEDSWLNNVSEWLFSHPSITPDAGGLAEFRAHLRAAGVRPALRDLDLGTLRQRCDRLIDRLADDIDWSQYDVVGFSIMFQQLNASLRLASRIKARFPKARVVFGGSAMERPMGDAVFERYPWLDAVFSGYSDTTFPEYVGALPPRGREPITDAGPNDLDVLPVPSFTEYLRAVDDLGLPGRIVPQILLETSRGCWYGEKHHCTFCGMNGLQMRFRRKSAERVFDEVRELSRHGLPLFTTDTILAHEFFRDLFPRMIREGLKFPAFFEVKANLTREQIETIAAVGINRVQPGIESLSTPILKIMRKGVTSVKNVWFLRSAEELSIASQWNILYGFPREEPAEYESMARLVPKLAHFEPPTGCGKLHLLRFSPNHTDASSLGFTDVRPKPSYAIAFGPHARLNDQAYVFEASYEDGRDPDEYTRKLNEEVTEWQRLKALPFAPRCEVFEVLGVRFIYDSRRHDRVGRALPALHRLSDAEWKLLELCEGPTSRSALERTWGSEEPLWPIVDRFLARGWLLDADERLVRLVVVRKERSPARELARVLRVKSATLMRRLRATEFVGGTPRGRPTT